MTGLTTAAMPVAGPILFGARNLGAASRYRSTVDSGQVILYLAIAAAVIAVVCLGVYFGTRVAHRRRHNSHGSLLHSLCRVHGLDRGTRRLLKQVARHHKLAHPARVFTEPQWLDPARLRGAMRRQASRVAAVHDRLFGRGGT